MKNKIIKFFAITAFSVAVLLLLGSVPKTSNHSEVVNHKEFSNINSSASDMLSEDFSAIIQKNPSILLEITVE